MSQRQVDTTYVTAEWSINANKSLYFRQDASTQPLPSKLGTVKKVSFRGTYKAERQQYKAFYIEYFLPPSELASQDVDDSDFQVDDTNTAVFLVDNFTLSFGTNIQFGVSHELTQRYRQAKLQRFNDKGAWLREYINEDPQDQFNSSSGLAPADIVGGNLPPQAPPAVFGQTNLQGGLSLSQNMLLSQDPSGGNRKKKKKIVSNVYNNHTKVISYFCLACFL